MIDSINYSSRENLPLEEQLLFESKAMAQYALKNGYTVPDSLISELQNYIQNFDNRNGEIKAAQNNTNIKTLTQIHNKLIRIISPVKPRTVAVLAAESKNSSLLKFLGPVSLVRRMMLTALISLVGLFLTSLNPEVDGKASNFSLFTNSGFSLFVNELFLLFAASIGASFFALFTANKFIKDDSFDPKFEASYWIRYVLGLLAGVIIATLIPIEDYETQHFHGFGKPILALIGGFSAQVVYRIISRLTEALESLFKGDAKDISTAEESANNALQNEKAVKERMTIYSRLAKLQTKLASNGDKDFMQKEIEKLQEELMNPGSTDGDEIEYVKREEQEA
ncbi:MAG: hypothetical protein PVH88_04215 [Ignavibacteria bacterium]|jgi:hypothetical protein